MEPAYLCRAQSKAKLKARNGGKCGGLSWRSSTAHSAGLRVSELNAENATEIAMVNANWLYRRPVIPGKNAIGTNTAPRTADVAMIGPVTSFIATLAAII